MTTASRVVSLHHGEMRRVEVGGGTVRLPADLALIVRRLAERRDRWAPLVRFDPAQRWYTLLDATSDYQAWLLTWLPGQATDLHDHGGSAGAFAVVAGVLTERTVIPGRSRARRPTVLRCGRVRSFGPAHVHDIGNAGTAPAVSIHVYAPALEFMRRYTLHPQRGLVEVGREHAGADW